MLTKYLTMRPRSSYWQLRVPVPADIQGKVGRKEVTKSLGERDRAKAEEAALLILTDLRRQWIEVRKQQGSAERFPTEAEAAKILDDVFSSVYEMSRVGRSERYAKDPDAYEAWLRRQEAQLTRYVFDIDAKDFSRWKVAAERRLTRDGFQVQHESEWFKDFLREFAELTVAAMQVSSERDRGRLGAKPSSVAYERIQGLLGQEDGQQDVSFSALVESFMTQWKASADVKEGANTEQQKRATYRLFGEFFGDRSIRKVTSQGAALFRDELKLFDPNWARRPARRALHWNDLVKEVGGRPKGLSASTMNRHMRALQELWAWSKKRGHCDGENPFSGFSVKLKSGVNTHPYLPWEIDELRDLFDPPPKRTDLLEIMMVGMFSGMRIDEIASLTWDRIKTEECEGKKVYFFRVIDPKTPAGIPAGMPSVFSPVGRSLPPIADDAEPSSGLCGVQIQLKS